MTKEEWLVEFQVLHGRQPTDLEEAQGAIDGYQTVNLSQTGKKVAKFPRPKFDGKFFFKLFLLLLLAFFGYVVGFLFA